MFSSLIHSVKSETPDEIPPQNFSVKNESMEEMPSSSCQTKQSNELTGIYLTNIFSMDNQNGMNQNLFLDSDMRIRRRTRKPCANRLKGPLPLSDTFSNVFGIRTTERPGFIAECFICNKELYNNGGIRSHINSRKHKDAERYYKSTHIIKEEAPEEASYFSDQVHEPNSHTVSLDHTPFIKEEPMESESKDADKQEEEPKTQLYIKKRSWVYEAFEYNNRGFNCKHCKKTLNRICLYNNTLVHWGTTDLWNHLKRHHKKLFMELKSRTNDSRPTVDYANLLSQIPGEVLEKILSETSGEPNQIKDEEDPYSEFSQPILDIPSTSQFQNSDDDDEVDIKPSVTSEIVSIEEVNSEHGFQILEKSNKGNHYFYCKICKKHINKKKENPLLRHLNSIMHKRNAQAIARFVTRRISSGKLTKSKMFQPEYMENFEGIQTSTRGPDYYYCAFCKKDIVFIDLSYLEKHVKTLDHIVNMAKENVANTVEFDIPSGDPFQAKKFRILVQHPPPRFGLSATKKPESEKMPPSAYILFMMEQKKILMDEFPGIHQMDVFRKVGQMWNQLPQAKKLKYYREEKRLRRLKNADKIIYRRDRTKKCKFQLKNVPYNLRIKIGKIFNRRSAKQFTSWLALKNSKKRWATLKNKAINKIWSENLQNFEYKSKNLIDEENISEEINTIIKMEPEEHVESQENLAEGPSTSQSFSEIITKMEPEDDPEYSATPLFSSSIEPINSPIKLTEKAKILEIKFEDILSKKSREMMNPMNRITEMLKENLKTAVKKPTGYIKKVKERPITPPPLPSDFKYVPRKKRNIVPPIIKRIEGKLSPQSMYNNTDSSDEYEKISPAKKFRKS